MNDPALAAQLSAWLAETDIGLLELSGPAGSLRLVQSVRDGAVDGVACTSEGPAVEVQPITATTVGVFLDRHPLHGVPAVSPGSCHVNGAVLGFLRIGPLLQAIVAPCDCLVAEVLAAPGAAVGFGAPLFAIVPLAAQETP